MTITLPNWEKLSELAAKNKMSRSDFINALIENCSADIRLIKRISVVEE